MSNLANICSVVACVAVGLILRWAVALGPYSGEGKPPQFGDYEAQRHWMEITTNLPLEEWYVDTPDNNLQYWGLDYPPLSAFHSYLLGKHLFEPLLPESIELLTSQGYESHMHKFWMRFSVLISDLLLPSLVIFHLIFYNQFHEVKVSNHSKALILLLSVGTPPFILIDYGHFQYNCISLGLTVLAIIAVVHNQMSFTAIFFTLAIHHKQMSLYHSIPFFIEMVATTILRKKDILTAFRICCTIFSTLGLLWLPFGKELWPAIIARIFPLKRGVYEDKVGTFWYVLDRVVPYKNVLPDNEIARICAILSLIMLAPSALHHFWQSASQNASKEKRFKTFLLSLLNISLVFFLFSYHVHEKSIMLPILPAVLLIPWFPITMVWFISVGSLSLYPLLYEEGSNISLICIVIFFILTSVVGGIFKSASLYIKLAFITSISGYLVLIIGHHFLKPPERFPHLFQAAVAIYSFLHYAMFSMYFHFLQFASEESKKEIPIKSSDNQQKLKSKKRK